jgi:hypothetical protein
MSFSYQKRLKIPISIVKTPENAPLQHFLVRWRRCQQFPLNQRNSGRVSAKKTTKNDFKKANFDPQKVFFE